MERIFGDNSSYSEKTINELKQVMLISEQISPYMAKQVWEK